MSEPKFTKGPWRRGKNPCMTTVLSRQEGKAIYPEDGSHHIAWANAYTEEGKIDMVTALANAALIAAAPDMYALLLDIVTDYQCMPNPAVMADKIEAVLKKARGEE